MLGFSYAYLNYAALVLLTSFATGIDTAVPTTKLAIAFARFAFLKICNCYGIIQKYYYIDICKML